MCRSCPAGAARRAQGRLAVLNGDTVSLRTWQCFPPPGTGADGPEHPSLSPLGDEPTSSPRPSDSTASPPRPCRQTRAHRSCHLLLCVCSPGEHHVPSLRRRRARWSVSSERRRPLRRARNHCSEGDVNQDPRSLRQSPPPPRTSPLSPESPRP